MSSFPSRSKSFATAELIAVFWRSIIVCLTQFGLLLSGIVWQYPSFSLLVSRIRNYIPFRIRVCRWPVVGKIGLQGFNLFARAATSMATERKGGLPKVVADGLLAPYDSWSNRIATYKFVKDIPLSKSHPTWDVLENIESRLKEVAEWPIMMVWGMKDWCFRPECLDRLQEHWPAAEVHKMADAGHYVIEDEAEQVQLLVEDFLARHRV